MTTPRPNRNSQQVRSLIQTMGRSIDDARSRRLGPTSSGVSATGGGSADMQIGVAHVAAPAATSPVATPAVPAATPSAPHTPASPPPPVRAANEMFSEGGPRLKARPKKTS